MSKNLLIAASITGLALAGFLLYQRNRNETSRIFHKAADEAGDVQGKIEKHIRKAEKALEKDQKRSK